MTTREQQMWALSAGDEVLMGRLKEIDRWFPTAKALIFEKKRINDPFYIIKLISRWLIDWSILQTKERPRKMLELGARVLERAASEVYTAGQGWRINVARLL